MSEKFSLIKGIIYSQFDQKIGPKAVVWMPSELSKESRNLISLKTIQMLAGESGKVPESLAILPFPSINSKGLVKYIEIKDPTSRGSAIDSSLTLLFDEANDLIFYKYIKNFTAIFNEAAKKIVRLEEKKSDKKKVIQEINKFQKKIAYILNELREMEISTQEIAEFPAEVSDESKLSQWRYKLIVCGDPSVGKTSTILRFTDNAFRRTYIPTIGVNLSDKIIQYKDIEIKFVLWDIAGQSKFQKMRSYFYKGADGLLLIFDLTAPNSFKNIPNWYKDIKSFLKSDLPGLILGNKNDLIDKRKVKWEEGDIMAKKIGIEYYETSALTGENIQESFAKMAELLYNIKKKVPVKKATKRKSRSTKKKKTTKAK